MVDRIVTGASRGIGRALVLALARDSAPGDRIFALARDVAGLEELRRDLGSRVALIPVALDLARPLAARAVGERLCAEVGTGALLVHNAGIWPSRREIVDDREASFATNCVGPLALQAPLLERGRLARILVVGAGLLVKGRFDAARTPTGDDFSAIRTYASTKLAQAIAMRDVAREHPEVDLAVVHPGVVRTDLGARSGLSGFILRRIKRRWESPEVCAERLARLIARPRWQRTAGEAPWFEEEAERPWPQPVERDAPSVRRALAEDAARTATAGRSALAE